MVLTKKKKKILPCGLKIAQHSPSAEWGNVWASPSRGGGRGRLQVGTRGRGSSLCGRGVEGRKGKPRAPAVCLASCEAGGGADAAPLKPHDSADPRSPRATARTLSLERTQGRPGGSRTQKRGCRGAGENLRTATHHPCALGHLPRFPSLCLPIKRSRIIPGG